MIIAIDAMGGENAPAEIIEGAILATTTYSDLQVILVGKKEELSTDLQKKEYPLDRISIVPATQVIEMVDSPAKTLRKKKDSSIVKGLNLVKTGQAQAFVSAGNTGAVMAASLINLGRISGIKRPSIATIFPTKNGNTLLLDAGANVDSKADNLLQFALMGQIYLKHVLKINNPRIGILSNGEEKQKGNQLSTSSYELLASDQRIDNFIGNVEGRDIFNGKCDLIVCDGFVGNIVLKTTEGTASLIFDYFKEVLTKNIISKFAAFLIKPALREMFNKVDYRQYGGAPLLGVKGGVIICHGSSDRTAIMNAIKVARQTIINDVVQLIEKEVEKDGE